MTERCELCGNRMVMNWSYTTDPLGETGIFTLTRGGYCNVCIGCCLSNMENASVISIGDALQIAAR